MTGSYHIKPIHTVRCPVCHVAVNKIQLWNAVLEQKSSDNPPLQNKKKKTSGSPVLNKRELSTLFHPLKKANNPLPALDVTHTSFDYRLYNPYIIMTLSSTVTASIQQHIDSKSSQSLMFYSRRYNGRRMDCCFYTFVKSRSPGLPLPPFYFLYPLEESQGSFLKV